MQHDHRAPDGFGGVESCSAPYPVRNECAAYGNSRSFEQARFAGSKGNQAEAKVTLGQILSGAGVREGGRPPRNPHPAGRDWGRGVRNGTDFIAIAITHYGKFFEDSEETFFKKVSSAGVRACARQRLKVFDCSYYCGLLKATPRNSRFAP